ncbi:MAG: lamin tail domain-containing protein, partial [Verrucomicrobiota bacterium]
TGALDLQGLVMENGYLTVSNGASLNLVDSRLQDFNGAMLEADSAGNVTAERTIFRDYGRMNIVGSPSVFRHCLLERISDLGLSISGDGSVHQWLNSTAREAIAPDVTGLSVAGDTSLTVRDGLFHDFNQFGVSVNGSHGIMEDTLIYDIGTFGVRLLGGASVTQDHVTVANCSTGISGTLTLLENSILWDNGAPFNPNPDSATYSDIQLPNDAIHPGTGNFNRNPWFVDPSDGDYRLQTISPARLSDESGADRGTAFPNGANPIAPANLIAFNSGPVGIVLNWTDTGPDEEWFDIERHDGSSWINVARVAADSTGYFDQNLNQNTLYTYRVRSVHRRGRSLPSNTASAQTSLIPSSQNLADDLRITELHYHPANGVFDGDEIEFIEFKNTGAQPLDLSGVFFSEGLDFTFPDNTLLMPGDFFVLVRNPIAFTNRYPAVTPDGVYAGGGLANGGEQLRIADSNGVDVLVFEYDNAWYSTTDGGGYSLVRTQPWSDPDQAASWRPSTGLHGSPNADDPAPAFGTIVINEVLAHTDPPFEDAIELYNAGTSMVNIADWRLSDDPDELDKFRIPGGTMLNPGDFAVFYEADFGSGPNPFFLSELGDEVILSSAVGNNFGPYRTRVDFGASDQAVSFGRIPRSDGDVDFCRLDATTFGEDAPATVAEFRMGTGDSNSPPAVGPVVINEIMYHPPDGGDEFIELLNNTASLVPLFDLANPSNTWRLTNAVEFVFPPNVSIPPGERILVVDIDPELFRTRYGLALSQAIYGPYSGRLANGGERLELHKPGAPEPDGGVPYILMDKVAYDDLPPWPEAADGTGPSLERVSANAYGNDPASWEASTLGGTPGAANSIGGLPVLAFALPETSATEGDSNLLVRVLLQPASATGVLVQYAVTGGDAAGGGIDYTLPNGTLSFWPWDTEKTIEVQLHDNGLSEPDEWFEITLANPANAQLGGQFVHRINLSDEDGGTLDAPSFVQPSTLFLDSLLVTITSSLPDAVIYYTSDGSNPDRSSMIYTGPFTVTNSVKIKAIAVRGGFANSTFTEAVYTRVAPTLDDEDADGIPDLWEINLTVIDTNDSLDSLFDIMPDGDLDADSFTEFEEYMAGTDPLDPLSFPMIDIALTNGFEAVSTFGISTSDKVGYSGRTRFYRIEQNTNMPVDVWMALPGMDNLPGNDMPLIYSNPIQGSPPFRFYRTQTWLDP